MGLARTEHQNVRFKPVVQHPHVDVFPKQLLPEELFDLLAHRLVLKLTSNHAAKITASIGYRNVRPRRPAMFEPSRKILDFSLT